MRGGLCAWAMCGLGSSVLGLLAGLGVPGAGGSEDCAQVWKLNQPPSLKERRARLEAGSMTLLDDAVGISSHPRWLARCWTERSDNH